MQLRLYTRPSNFILLAIALVPCMSFSQSTSKPSPHAATLKQKAPEISASYTAEQEEQDKLKLAFAWRELNLLSNLKGRNLKVENDVLLNQVAELQGGRPDLEKLETDKGYVVSATEAVEIQAAFTDIWFVSRDANKQSQTGDAQGRFDEAIKNCFPEQLDAVTSLEDANRNCQAIDEIYNLIAPLTSKSAQSISLFHEPATAHPTAAQRMMSEDAARMRLDAASKRPLQRKKKILAADELLLNTDKELRIDEWNNAMVSRHNIAHPEHLLASDSFLHDQLLGLRHTLLSVNEKAR